MESLEQSQQRKASATNNIRYVSIDASGFVVGRFSIPKDMPMEIPQGLKIVVPRDRQIPAGEIRFDLRKVRKDVNIVESIDDVRASWTPLEPSLDGIKLQKIEQLDIQYARTFESIRGPLARIHDWKRQKAEKNPKDLEAEAIIQAASAEDQHLDRLETERRDKKQRMLDASTIEEVEAILNEPIDGGK